MPITDETQKSKIFIILGLPQKTTAFGILGLATIAGPAGEQFTLDGVKSQIDSALAATSTSEDTLINAATSSILAEFDNNDIWLRETKVWQDGNSSGVLYDTSARMEILRRRLSDILGVYVPQGGFMAAFNRISRPKAGPSR